MSECGDYVVVDTEKNGTVYFWEHGLNGKSTYLASDIIEFLEALEAETKDIVDDTEYQVIGHWVNPDFLKDQQDEGNTHNP